VSDSTATAIASGAGPLIAALIGAYQLWLKTSVEQQRDLPFDVDRLEVLIRRIRGIRRNLALFILLVAAVTAIPVGGTIAAVTDINFARPVSLPKVLVAFVAAVGVVHVVFLIGRMRSLSHELRTASGRMAHRTT
jgi:hypothetical protein